MKKIGAGYYYNVYDLGNARVVKKLKRGFSLFFHIWKVNLFKPRAIGEYRTALRNIPRIKAMYEEIIRRVKDMEVLGNPLFQEEINYEQDKGVLVGYRMKDASEEEYESFVEQYIALIKELWTLGCHEKVYNFTINNAFNTKGKLILIDFNEVTFEKDIVIKSISEKRWLTRYSFLSLPEQRKAYYKKRMAEEITLTTLEALWEKELV